MVARATDSARKRRPDAWEVKAGLSDADQRKVFAWARAYGYARAIELVKEELKIDAPSMSAFQSWYSWFAVQESEERVHKAIADGGAIRELAESTGDVSQAMVAALESEASAAILSGDPDRIKLLVSLALKAREGRFEENKYRDAMKSSIERGLDALAEQAQGNKEALKYYAKFREAIMQSVEEAAA